MKNLVIILITILASALSGSAEDNIISYVSVGFDGYFKPDSVSPIFITLINTGKSSVYGIISLEQGDQYSPPSCSYQREIDLPGPSKKQLIFYMVLRENHSILFSLITREGKISKEISSNSIKKLKKALWLNVCDNPYNIQNKTITEDVQNVDIPYTMLPDHYTGFQSVSGVVLNNPQILFNDDIPSETTDSPSHQFNRDSSSQTSLSPQTQSLLDWTSDGGSLIVFNAKNIKKNSISKILGPMFKPPDFLSSKKRFTQTPYSRGNIFWFNDSLEIGKTREFLYSKEFISQIPAMNEGPRNPNHPAYQDSYGLSYLNEFFRGYLIGEINLTWVIWLVLTYLAFIGPFDYFIYRKYRKSMLTWVILLSSIFVFSMFVYLKCHWLKSGDMRTVSLNIMDIMPNTGQAIGRSFFGVYSTRNADYTIYSEQSGTFLTSYPISLYNQESFVRSLITHQDRDFTINVRIPIYSCKMYSGVWTCPSPIEIKIKPFIDSKPMLKMDIPENIQIENGYMVTDEYVYDLIEYNRAKGLWEINNRDWNNSYASEENIRYGRKHSINDAYNVLKAISFCSKINEIFDKRRNTPNSNLPSYYYTTVTFDTYEQNLDLSKYLKRKNVVILLFVKKSLNHFHIKGESPKYEEINLIRLVVPLRSND